MGPHTIIGLRQFIWLAGVSTSQNEYCSIATDRLIVFLQVTTLTARMPISREKHAVEYTPLNQRVLEAESP